MLKLTAMSLLAATMTGLMGMGLADAPTPPKPGGRVMPWEATEIQAQYGAPVVAAETIGEDRKFQLSDGRYFEVGYATLYKWKRTYLEKTISGVSMKCTQDSGCFIFINDRGPYVISSDPMKLLEQSNVQLQLMKPLGKDAGFIQPQGRLLDIGAAQAVQPAAPAREEIVAIARAAPISQPRLLDTPAPQPSTPPQRGGGVTFSWGAANTFDQEKYAEWRDSSNRIIQTGPKSGGGTFDYRYYQQQQGRDLDAGYTPAPGGRTSMPSSPGVTPSEQTARHYSTDQEFASLPRTAPDVAFAKAILSAVEPGRQVAAGGILDSLVSVFLGPPDVPPPRSQRASAVLPARSLDTPSALLHPQLVSSAARPELPSAFEASPWTVSTPAPANYVAAAVRDARQAAYVSTPLPQYIHTSPLPAPIGAKPSVSLIDRVTEFFAPSSPTIPATSRPAIQVADSAPLKVQPIYGPQLPEGWTKPSVDLAVAAAEAEEAKRLAVSTAKPPMVQTNYEPVTRALLNTAWALTAPTPKAPVPTIRRAQYTPQKEFSALPFVIGGAAVLVGLILFLNRRD